MMELMYHCLALGFRGKYRVPGRAGDRSLNAVRVAAARFLRNKEAEDAPLSPNWRGVIASDEPQRFIVPIWVMAATAIVVSTLIYLGLSMTLSTHATKLTTLVRALPPADRTAITRAVPKAEPPPPPPAVVDFALLPEFEAAAPESLRPALKGSESISLARLVIQATAPELFQSSRANLTDGFEPLIDSVAKVILDNVDLIGNITIIGHTDSVPLQSSNPLSTNQRLSEARAATIAELLIQRGVPADRVRSEGRAATDPVADNGTREDARRTGASRFWSRRDCKMFILRFIWAVITSRILWTLIGLTLLALLIWVFSPIVQVGRSSAFRVRDRSIGHYRRPGHPVADLADHCATTRHPRQSYVRG
jgi:type VI secretion system protein ImpK